MSVKSEILDGRGRGRSAEVLPSGSLSVQVLPETARGVDVSAIANQLVLNQLFSDDSGSTEQAVDGSATPVEFAIRAEQGSTKWVTGFRLIIIGANLDIGTNQLRRYADSASGLSNGIEIETSQSGETTKIAVNPITTIADYFLYQQDFTSLVSAISNNEDLLTFDFGFPRPVVLTEGSTDKVIIRINDDMTAALGTANASQFAVGRGWKEILK
jgi:hypothetical protein